MVSTRNLKMATMTVPRTRATIAPGMRMEIPRHTTMMATVPAASSVASIEMRVEVLRQSFHALPEHAGNLFQT